MGKKSILGSSFLGSSFIQIKCLANFMLLTKKLFPSKFSFSESFPAETKKKKVEPKKTKACRILSFWELPVYMSYIN